jgi:hypothetical protein
MEGFKTTLFALALVIATTTTNAQVTVRGSPSCGTWVKDREAGGSPRLINLAWVVGYISGRAVESNKNVIRGTDNDSISLWLDNYCRNNPLKSVDDGADDLFVELRRIKGL